MRNIAPMLGLNHIYIEAFTLIFLTNLDIDTYVCDAFFCGNAYFYRNATIKMAKFDQIWPNLFFLPYAHINPVFWAQTDLTRWNHIFHTSRGNSGYIWISDMCPFDCSVGRFKVTLLKCSFWAKNPFLEVSSNPFDAIMMGNQNFPSFVFVFVFLYVYT